MDDKVFYLFTCRCLRWKYATRYSLRKSIITWLSGGICRTRHLSMLCGWKPGRLHACSQEPRPLPPVGNLTRQVPTNRQGPPLPSLVPSAVPAYSRSAQQPNLASVVVLLLTAMWYNSLNSVEVAVVRAGLAVRTKECTKILHNASIRLCTAQSPRRPLCPHTHNDRENDRSTATTIAQRTIEPPLKRCYSGFFAVLEDKETLIASSVPVPDLDVVWTACGADKGPEARPL